MKSSRPSAKELSRLLPAYKIIMQTGFAQRSITPAVPCQLAGYSAYRMATGVHDELHARALVLRDDERAVVILQLDVLGVDELFIDRMDAKLREIGLTKDQLLVFCAHTHSSFGGIFDVSHGMKAMLKDLLGQENEALLGMLAEQSFDAIREAIGDTRDAGIRMFKDQLSGVGTNRHSPDDPSDRDVFVADILRDDGRRAVLYSLSCHPTIMNNDNLLLSADFTGYANKAISQFCEMAVFVNGSAGDMSTRFTRRESTFDECSRIGGIVGLKVSEMLEGAGRHVPLSEVSLVYHTVYLKRVVSDSPDEAAKKYSIAENNLRKVLARTTDPSGIRKAQSYVEGASANLLRSQLPQDGQTTEIPVKVGILSLNDRKIVCSPFELFSTLALRLKEKARVEMFGYANELLGYLADADSYENMEYEALSSDFSCGEGEVYIDKVLELLD